jgi:hypothetical protein
MVVLLLDAAGFENTTMHLFEERNYNIVNYVHSGCIFMQIGVLGGCGCAQQQTHIDSN